MELPNYSSQLMQQLWTLRKDDLFCDCTILVGDEPHRAHKLVLAASSMLFRSILKSSDTISIDTTLVSHQEFGSLLDMVYTGKLPVGKHNVSRIIAAADGLQMYDVAIGFRNVLSSFVNNPPLVTLTSTQSLKPEASASPEGEALTDDNQTGPNVKQEEGHPRGNEESACSSTQIRLTESSAASQQHSRSECDEQPKARNDDEQSEKEMEDEDKDKADPSSMRYSCSSCKKGFAYRCRMLAHTKRCRVARPTGQQCRLCPQKLPTQLALQRHQTQAHRSIVRAKKKVACDLCGRTFAHPSGMIYHRRTEHFEEKPFGCEECGAKFGANSSLKNHMRLHTGEKPYRCKHCDLSFRVAAALSYHTKKKHSEGKMYVCQYCKAVFAQSIELTRHVRTHTGDRPYVCRECGKGYSQASGLTVHLQTFHKLAEPQDCQKCCLSFSSLEEHRQHIEECHSKEFHKCPTCHKVFNSAALLDKHKATHTGTKPFSCDLCNKSYQQLSGLWYHNRTTHPDVFANNTRQLKTLFQCETCFKFFPCASIMAKHQAAEHQGAAAEAELQCPCCAAVFLEEELLQEHVTSQHQSSQSFSCTLCSVVCSSHVELQEHLLSFHMEEQELQEAPSQTADPAEASAAEGAETAVADEQPRANQQVIIAVTGGRVATSSAEVVEVNMDELLGSSITFICDGKLSAP